MKADNTIPTHNINENFTINIEPISYQNPYDFNRIHRHNYYEILFFNKGGGYQLIDFDKVTIHDQSCYVIKPRQVHLLQREAHADGLLIQFEGSCIAPELVQKLSILQYYSDVKAVFENEEMCFKKVMPFVSILENNKEDKGLFSHEKSLHLLYTLLYNLEELVLRNSKVIESKTSLCNNFTRLVSEKLNSLTINEYANMLHVSTKKLTEVVKNKYGITPLKFIHNALLLEIKRELVFNDMNLKEVSYSYNFDSPSNFSLFVKKNTGFTPSQLQKELRKTL